MPPWMPVAWRASWYSRPSTVTVRGSYAVSRLRIAPASWMALRPFHGRAEWAATPRAVTSTRSVPLQPPSIWAAVGSRRDREVGLEEVWAGLLDEPQAVELAVDLLALVEDDGQVARGLEDLLGDLELDRHAALHVDRAATDEVVPLAPGGQVRRVRGERDRVDVTGQHDPLGPPEVGACDQRVADAGHLEMTERAQGGLDGVAQRRLVVADRLDVAQRRRQRGDVDGEVQGRRGCGDRSHAQQPIQRPFPDR